MPWPKTTNRLAVSCITQVIDSNNRMRVTMASARPKIRVRACICLGMRLTRIEIMMMLSMPRTISRAVRVKKAIQISGLVSHSMCIPLSKC
ncbi:Uncharacterised protein [Mycobacterium tuberculosis]|nr:Uncharacterised protein [Mycobacterium tuberculosis]